MVFKLINGGLVFELSLLTKSRAQLREKLLRDLGSDIRKVKESKNRVSFDLDPVLMCAGCSNELSLSSVKSS